MEEFIAIRRAKVVHLSVMLSVAAYGALCIAAALTQLGQY
jgi:hypothetical protein